MNEAAMEKKLLKKCILKNNVGLRFSFFHLFCFIAAPRECCGGDS
jgi:hypothetical protein